MGRSAGPGVMVSWRPPSLIDKLATQRWHSEHVSTFLFNMRYKVMQRREMKHILI